MKSPSFYNLLFTDYSLTKQAPYLESLQFTCMHVELNFIVRKLHIPQDSSTFDASYKHIFVKSRYREEIS